MAIILGSGLSGLSAAYYLLLKYPKALPTIIEASNRTGGWIKSNTQKDGIVFEQGPRTVRPMGAAGANTLNLVEDLGLGDKIKPILATHPAAVNRMIFANSELHLLPTSIKSLFIQQKPFSKPLIRFLMNDVVSASTPVVDESIYDFVTRRFGKEIGDYLISPMICGICAGNAKEISVKFLMENLFEKEQKHGSITKGFLASLFETKPKLSGPMGKLNERALKEKWSVYSFEGGIEILPRKLEQSLKDKKVDFLMNTTCTSLDIGDKITANLSSGKTIVTDSVISSIPAKELSKLVQSKHPNLAALLDRIKTVSLAVVNLQYNEKLLNQDGFGFLVCPTEKRPILGVIYDSCCFQYENKTVLTAMLGGHWFHEYFSDKTTEAEFLDVAKKQIKDILKIDKEPDNFKVNILRNAIPQYVVGHKENLDKIYQYIFDNNLKLYLCGSSYHGVGINDVIMSAKNVVNKLM